MLQTRAETLCLIPSNTEHIGQPRGQQKATTAQELEGRAASSPKTDCVPQEPTDPQTPWGGLGCPGAPGRSADLPGGLGKGVARRLSFSSPLRLGKNWVLNWPETQDTWKQVSPRPSRGHPPVDKRAESQEWRPHTSWHTCCHSPRMVWPGLQGCREP